MSSFTLYIFDKRLALMSYFTINIHQRKNRNIFYVLLDPNKQFFFNILKDKVYFKSSDKITKTLG